MAEEREPLLSGSQPSRGIGGGGLSSRPPIVGGDFYASGGNSSGGHSSVPTASTSSYSTENGQLSHKCIKFY